MVSLVSNRHFRATMRHRLSVNARWMVSITFDAVLQQKQLTSWDAGNGAPTATTMLMQNGVDPSTLSQAQLTQLANGNPNVQKALAQQYANNLMQHHQRPGMGDKSHSNPGALQQGSPMMTQGPDGSMQLNNDFFGANPTGAMQRGPPGNSSSGTGALADYQMQLMLLEQQNKKRLMMARQEQAAGDSSGGPGAPGMMGQPGFTPMSPRGSRNGQSPIMNDQMKRGTPKMGQNSPLPDGMMPGARASPGAHGFEGVNMPPNMTPQFYTQMMNGQPGMMRPPPGHPGFQGPHGPINPHQMEMLARQQGGMRMPNIGWPGPQGMPGQPGVQQQPQPLGDNPQMRSHMPPPQAPPQGINSAARTQPSSPQQPPAPPTPSQTKSGKQGKGPAKEAAKKVCSVCQVLLLEGTILTPRRSRISRRTKALRQRRHRAQKPSSLPPRRLHLRSRLCIRIRLPQNQDP